MRTFNLIRQLEAMSGAATSSEEEKRRHGGIGGLAVICTAGTRPGRWNCGGPSMALGRVAAHAASAAATAGAAFALRAVRVRATSVRAAAARPPTSWGTCRPPDARAAHRARVCACWSSRGLRLAGQQADNVDAVVPSFFCLRPRVSRFAIGLRRCRTQEALSMANARRRRRGGDQFTDTPS